MKRAAEIDSLKLQSLLNIIDVLSEDDAKVVNERVNDRLLEFERIKKCDRIQKAMNIFNDIISSDKDFEFIEINENQISSVGHLFKIEGEYIIDFEWSGIIITRFDPYMCFKYRFSEDSTWELRKSSTHYDPTDLDTTYFDRVSCVIRFAKVAYETLRPRVFEYFMTDKHFVGLTPEQDMGRMIERELE